MNKMQTKPTPMAGPAPTDLLEGWDTVFAIRYTDVNSAIVKAGSSPDTFFEELTHGTDNDGTANDNVQGQEVFSIDGTFSDWALTIGGAGHNVFMSLPVPSLTFKHTGDADEVRTNVVYTIRVEMDSVPQPEPGPDGGVVHALRLKLPNGTNAVVTVEDCTYAGSDSDLYVKTWLVSLMGNWLNKNLQDFNHTFAVVNVGAKAAVDKFQWLMPTHTSYAVIDDNVSVATGILGVLCMTENRDPSPDQIITRETIPEGERSSFLISKERFLWKMLMPGMGTMFSGPIEEDPAKVWPTGYFDLTDNNTAITNNAGLRIDHMTVGKEVCPCKIDERTMIVKMEETYLDVLFEDLRHPYFKHFGDYWLNIHHHFQTRNIARLNDNQVFDLVPGSGTAELKVATHTAFAKKTKFAEKVEWALIFVNILTLLFPLAKAGWLKYVAQDVEETVDGALQVANVVEEGAVNEAAAEDLAADGAQAAEEMATSGTSKLGKWLVGVIVSKRAAAIFTMTALLTAEEILAKLADKDAEKELPQYKEFAATVMAPITWPEAAAEYKVTAVQFNGSFQTIGDPGFSF